MSDYLSKKNFHERDAHITFDEGPHIYTIDGDSSFMSVTTFLKNNFEKFDADFVIDRMMKSKNWPNSKYYGQTKEEIKDMWEKNRVESSTLGTELHKNIEDFYNNIPVENDSVEYGYFKNYYEDHKHLVPFRTEWMVWDKELKLAGSIDMTYELEDGTIYIYDWKRSKDICKAPYNFKSSTNPVISHIPDSNFWHYSLQLNTYKAILEKNYGKKIGQMCLVVMHPNFKNYKKFEVPDLSDEVSCLFEQRKNFIINNT